MLSLGMVCSLSLFSACIAPFFLEQNSQSDKGSRKITIIPLYLNAGQISLLHHAIPLLEGVQLDEEYSNYRNIYYNLNDPNKKRKILYIIITTRF